MKIEVLGTGCSKCKEQEENVRKAVEGIKDVEIVKITDINQIIEYGIMSTPAIVIDGEVKSHGEISSVEEIKKWL